MRHDPRTGIFNGSYINHAVRFNVQDAFLESDISDDGLTRAFTHMSIRCNPGAPKGVPSEVIKPLLAADPDLVDLEQRFTALRTKLKRKYKFIRRAPKKKWTEHKDLRKQLTNAKKNLRTDIDDAYRKHYFFQIHNKMMEKQLQRPSDMTAVEEDAITTEDPEPVIDYQLQERAQLQQVLCNLSKNLSPQAIVIRKVLAINLMVALASRQEFQTRKPRSTPAFKELVKREYDTPDLFPPSDEFPAVCQKTQCIFCIGNMQLSYTQRTRTFRRISHMWDHVDNLHLRYIRAEQQMICPHPSCDRLVLNTMMLFKNHVASMHKINLRP